MKNGPRNILPLTAVLLFLGAAVWFVLAGGIAGTRAFFTTQQASTGNTFTAAASFQYSQLAISGVGATPICGGANISWQTNIPADSVVQWSIHSSGPYSSVSDAGLVTDHHITLSGISSNTKIYYVVSSTDAGGSTAVSAESSFITAAAGKPTLGLSKIRAYWESYTAYLAGTLSVDFRISNSGSIAASNLLVEGTSNSNGVIFLSSTAVADIPAGGSAAFTIEYKLQSPVTNFVSTIYVAASDPCGNLYAYPGPYPGA